MNATLINTNSIEDDFQRKGNNAKEGETFHIEGN